MSKSFGVALTGDFFDEEGRLVYPDFDLSALDSVGGIEVSPFAEHRTEIGADQLEEAQAVIVLSPQVTRASLADLSDLLMVSRFGVGYDGVDVDACTEANILLSITKGAVDRPVAEATVGWLLALSHHLRAKDQLVRDGKWEARGGYIGCELRDRTLGVIGFGGIGRELVRLLQGFGMTQPQVYDPFVNESDADSLGVRLGSLNSVLAESDFVSIHCPLTNATRGMIGAKELAMIKPSAYLINTARGGIVDEDALYDALVTGRLAGAAVDCFAEEPMTKPHRLCELPNVLLAPHSIAWTHELFRDIGAMAIQSVLDLAHGRNPYGVVNPEVFEKPIFQQKWERLRLRS